MLSTMSFLTRPSRNQTGGGEWSSQKYTMFRRVLVSVANRTKTI